MITAAAMSSMNVKRLVAVRMATTMLNSFHVRFVFLRSKSAISSCTPVDVRERVIQCLYNGDCVIMLPSDSLGDSWKSVFTTDILQGTGA